MQNQKHYFYKTLFLMPIVFIFFTIFLITLILEFKHPLQNNYNRAYLDKIDLLKSFETKKRIIFIGGSNLAFGMDSLKIEKEFPEYKVINTAVHAGIGLRYMLADIKKNIKKEDIIIIVPEYNHFYNSGAGDYALWEVLSSKKNLENLDFLDFFKSLPGLLVGVKGILIASESEKDEFYQKFTYDRRGFNKNGDYVNHWKYAAKSNIPSALIKESKLTISIFNYLEEFIKESKFKGANVRLLPPVFQKTSFDLNKNKIEEISLKLTTKFEIEPKEFRYEDKFFFDTVYHLNREGVEKRTNQIILYLKHINL
ncbi:MAG: hypothetical protein ACRC5T_06050 [Cetobacterium sp.]